MALNLESKISLNSAGFERGMHRVKESVSDGVKSFVIGAIGVGTIEEAFRRTMETASDLVDESNRLSVTVEQIQLMKQAAKEAGTEIESVSGALEKLNIARAKALSNSKESPKTVEQFGKLGVQPEELTQKNGWELLSKNISNKVKSGNMEELIAPLRDILGKGAGEVVSFLKTDFAELDKSMRESGAIMSGEMAAKLDVLGDQFSRLSQIITTQLAPALLAFAQWAYKIILKSAGGVASAGAYWGGESGAAGGMGKALYTHFQSGWEKILRLVGGKGTRGAGDEYIAASDKLKAAGVAASIGADAPYKQRLAELEKMMKDAAAGVKEIPKTDFKTLIGDEAGGKAHKEKDALVKVGNFLGSSRGMVGNSAARLESHAAKTAQHTSQIVIYTKMTADMVGNLYGGRGPVRDASDLYGPAKKHPGTWPNNGGS